MAPEPINTGFLYLMKPLKIRVVAAHVAGWLLFQCLPLVFILSFSRATNIYNIISSPEYWEFCLYFIALFYVHSYILAPYLFTKKRWAWYASIMLLLLISVFYLRPFERVLRHAQPGPTMESRQELPRDEMRPPPGGPGSPPGDMGREMRGPDRRPPDGGPRHGPGRNHTPDIISIFLFIITLCLSAAIDVTRRLQLTEQRAARAEADKANAELSFLKAQINPHFLFNTLNNIYSMVITNNEHTADSLLKLSNILRYVIDESKEDYVSLQSEVDCISDYIDLQKLRLGKKVSLEYIVTGNLENKKIAPLILMTFIENVFKYGISNHEDAVLAIHLEANPENIHFYSQNTLFVVPRKAERTGIGINNTEKRLTHLYPGKHRLSITRENGLFMVDLLLQD